MTYVIQSLNQLFEVQKKKPTKYRFESQIRESLNRCKVVINRTLDRLLADCISRPSTLLPF